MYHLQDWDRLQTKTTLNDLGYYLPLGYWHQETGRRYHFFQTGSFTGNTEIQLEELENRYSSAGDFALKLIYGLFLEKFVTHLDNDRLENLANGSPDFFGNLYLADVIAMILAIRLEHQGWEVGINSLCPCSKAYKINPTEAGFHDLGDLNFNVWLGEQPPIFILELDNHRSVTLEPPKFKDLPRLKGDFTDLEAENRIALAVSGLDIETYYGYSPKERSLLVHWANKIASLGVENSLPMDCPECSYEWSAPLILGENLASFYFKLLSAPRLEDGSFREYLDSIASFLTIGENAPLKSISEVYRLSPKSRKDWVEKVKNFYEEQKKELNKAKSK